MAAADDGNRPVPRGTALLAKAFVLLRQISRRPHTGWTLTELAAASGLSHPTVHRILSSLIAQGMVAIRPGTRYYVLGPATLELAASMHPSFDPRPAAGEALRRLVTRCGGTAYLYMRSGFDLVCIAREDAPRQLRALPMEVGMRRPLCGSAGGIAMLLHLPKREQAAALRYGLAQMEAAGPRRRAAVEAMVQRSRELGFGINRDQLVPGMTGIGVAILAGDDPVAAFNVTRASSGLTENGIRNIAAILRSEAQALASVIASARDRPAGPADATASAERP